SMVIIDPTAEPTRRATAEEKPLAPRQFRTLDGLRVGLVSNTKLNADRVLLAIGDLLAERYQITSIVHEQKANFSLPAPDPIVDKIARESDIVIAGVGD